MVKMTNQVLFCSIFLFHPSSKYLKDSKTYFILDILVFILMN